MKKPDVDNFGGFAKEFEKASRQAGKPKQYLVPYFIASHPGSDVHAMIDLAQPIGGSMTQGGPLQ
jgi:hypothetical protein